MAKLTDDIKLYKRTYQALNSMSYVQRNIDQTKVSIGEFEQKLIEILLMSDDYSDFVAIFKDENNLDTISAISCIVAISNGIFEPKSSGSNGEKEIEYLLKINNIKFYREKKFDDLVHVGNLRFDFFLYEHNTAIEFQGAQHYMPVKIWGGESSLQENIIRDNIKKQWCIQNKIKLIEIKYNDNIYQSLKEQLNGIFN